MGKLVQQIPSWVQLALAVGALIVSMALAYGDLKAGLQNEQTQRQADVQRLQDADLRHAEDVREIKDMLRQEMDRHHPRQR